MPMATDTQNVDYEADGGCASTPALSVIITTPDCFDTIRSLVGALHAQTAREALELDGFICWQVVEMPNITSVAQAKAAGIRRARAPVVVLTEDHSFPAPDWAAALIEAHRRGWAVVGPAMCNANPDSYISWADFIIGYGPWFEPPAGGETDELPGHNTSYRRDLLLGCGARLEALLGAEPVLHRQLRASGYRLYLEPAAKTAHLNFTDLARWIPYLFHSARLFAAQRASNWPLSRRALYSAGAPLIPLVRLKRLWPAAMRTQAGFAPRLYAALVFALIIDAAGQCVGYAAGAGPAAQHLAHLEYHRDRRSLHFAPRAAQSQP
jgi:hypothetical protein